MKRFYSHYTFIYPDIHLKNFILELDCDNHITNCFPFEKEIENTCFYSGLLIFVPDHQKFDYEIISGLKKEITNNTVRPNNKKEIYLPSKHAYSVYTEDGILL